MDSSFHILDKLRMCPTIQQGGTQTIQQSIYLTHDNPCGANKLIFQGMGYTQIRYIDLKNYLDDILGTDEMRLLFEEVRIDGTDFMNSPLDEQKQFKYLYSLSNWAKAGINNLPIPINYYPGYQFSFSVFDGSGCLIYGSNSPTLTIISKTNGIYTRNTTTLQQVYDINNFKYVPSVSSTNLYKICNDYLLLPFVNQTNVINSDFIINQLSLPETIMAVSSLLVDSANTRTFGVPKYGFSNRSNQLQVGGIAYYCAHIIDIYSIPDVNGETTLIESIFARIALEENGPPVVSMTPLYSTIPIQKISQAKKEHLETEDILFTLTSTNNKQTNQNQYESPKYKMLSTLLSMKKIFK